MQARLAVRIAKQRIIDLFGTEALVDLNLEEIEYDDARSQWHITLGFGRPWDQAGEATTLAAEVARRTYKFVVVNKHGKTLSVKTRKLGHTG